MLLLPPLPALPLPKPSKNTLMPGPSKGRACCKPRTARSGFSFWLCHLIVLFPSTSRVAASRPKHAPRLALRGMPHFHQHKQVTEPSFLGNGSVAGLDPGSALARIGHYDVTCMPPHSLRQSGLREFRSVVACAQVCSHHVSQIRVMYGVQDVRADMVGKVPTRTCDAPFQEHGIVARRQKVGVVVGFEQQRVTTLQPFHHRFCRMAQVGQ